MTWILFNAKLINNFVGVSGVASNRRTAASLPNECFDNVYEGPFIPQHPLNAQSTQPSCSKYLYSDSINQPNLKTHLKSRLHNKSVIKFHV